MRSGLGLVSFVKTPLVRPANLFGAKWSTTLLGENVCISLFGLIYGGGIPTAFCSHYWLIGCLDGVTVMSSMGVNFPIYSVFGVWEGGWTSSPA